MSSNFSKKSFSDNISPVYFFFKIYFPILPSGKEIETTIRFIFENINACKSATDGGLPPISCNKISFLRKPFCLWWTCRERNAPLSQGPGGAFLCDLCMALSKKRTKYDLPFKFIFSKKTLFCLTFTKTVIE